jgi:hypothetical protein
MSNEYIFDSTEFFEKLHKERAQQEGVPAPHHPRTGHAHGLLWVF